jgi:DNA replication regulator SLD3
MRSLTAPPISNLKRETSEAPSFAGIPIADGQPNHVSRGGILSSKRFSQREVDLSSLGTVASTKAQKKASIEAELKEAISGIKRPNRKLAGKVLTETAEKRATMTPRPKSKSTRSFTGIWH